MKNVLAILLLMTASFGLMAAQHNESIPVLDVSLSELVSNPTFYNNVVVRVRGAAVARFEANFICESVDDIDNQNGHCLWLEPVAKDGLLEPIDPALYHNKIVLLTGVFDKDYRGRGSFRGAIAPISVVASGSHTRGDIPPPSPEPSANKSFKPKPLRGSA